MIPKQPQPWFFLLCCSTNIEISPKLTPKNQGDTFVKPSATHFARRCVRDAYASRERSLTGILQLKSWGGRKDVRRPRWLQILGAMFFFGLWRNQTLDVLDILLVIMSICQLFQPNAFKWLQLQPWNPKRRKEPKNHPIKTKNHLNQTSKPPWPVCPTSPIGQST